MTSANSKAEPDSASRAVIPVEPVLPPVRLEEIAEGLEKRSSSIARRESTPQFSIDQKREMSKIWISGFLGLFLWLILGGLIVAHFAAISLFSWRMLEATDTENLTGSLQTVSSPSPQTVPPSPPPASQDTSPQNIERYEKVVATVNDTAKSLYTFLAPLATAITGYYFTSKSGELKGESDSSN